MVCLILWSVVSMKFKKQQKFWVVGRRITRFWSGMPVSARRRLLKDWRRRLSKAMCPSRSRTSRFGPLICRTSKPARSIVAVLKRRFRIWSKKSKRQATWFCSLMKSIKFLVPVRLAAKSLAAKGWPISLSRRYLAVRLPWLAQRPRMSIATRSWRTARWHGGSTMSPLMNRPRLIPLRFWKASRSFMNSIITFNCQKMFWRLRLITVSNIYHSGHCRIKPSIWLTWRRRIWQASIRLLIRLNSRNRLRIWTLKRMLQPRRRTSKKPLTLRRRLPTSNISLMVRKTRSLSLQRLMM